MDRRGVCRVHGRRVGSEPTAADARAGVGGQGAQNVRAYGKRGRSTARRDGEPRSRRL